MYLPQRNYYRINSGKVKICICIQKNFGRLENCICNQKTEPVKNKRKIRKLKLSKKEKIPKKSKINKMPKKQKCQKNQKEKSNSSSLLSLSSFSVPPCLCLRAMLCVVACAVWPAEDPRESIQEVRVCTFKSSTCMPATRANVETRVGEVPAHTGTF